MAAVSRRNFFESLFETSQSRLGINSSLDEYTLPLSRLQVQHLLRRATFSLSNNIIDKYVGKTASFVVDELFAKADASINPTPPFFANDHIKNPGNLNGKQREEAEAKKSLLVGDYNLALGEWWVGVMKKDTESFLEKMVLFWHDHFATQFASCDNIPSISMYRQNDLFRKNYAGNLRTLLEQISIDGAMLKYLNGNENISESPNENFARELMELFSLGVGNYSEQDIREAAKILTGWKVSMFLDEGTPYKAFLNVNQFDKTSKLFMGEVFAVNYEVNEQNVFKNSVQKLIDVILTKKGLISAKYLSSKIYQYFVYSNVQKTDTLVVDQMAKLIIDNGFELKPMLKKLFKSQHFFDDLSIGNQIKSPAETIVALVKHIDYSDRYARNIMAALGLELFNPPNVAGWRGYRAWVSTKTLPTTIHFLKEIINNNSNTRLADWALSIEGSGDVHILTERFVELFLARPVSEDRFKKYKNTFLGGAPDYEWYEIIKNKDQAGQRVRSFLFEIIKAPEYFLF
jgi:uncharacterized protein (DUF1800 family)